jgi:hypothetical protein
MHTRTDCVVLKGVPASRVKGRMSVVKSWSDGLQTASIRHAVSLIVHAHIMHGGPESTHEE